jgi:hypothetical protein
MTRIALYHGHRYRQIKQAIVPRKQDLQKIYYHGTKHEDRAKHIMLDGIKPQDLKFSNYKGRDRPVAGRVYLTTDLEEALTYAEPIEEDTYGYLFVIDGLAIRNDIQPDEDMIGGLLNHPDFVPGWLHTLAETYLSAHELSLIEQEALTYPNLAVVGKKLLPHMSDQQKTELLDLVIPQSKYDYISQALSVAGTVWPRECWRFNWKMYLRALKSPAKLFFRIAEKIWIHKQDHWR